MTDNTTTAPENELTAEVSATGTPSRTNYEITPELRPHADAVLAMDPVNDVPPPYEFPEGHRWPALKATALPEAQRREVQAKLHALPPEERDAKEAKFTAAAVRSMRAAIRTQTGVGQNATPFHREMVAIARDVRDLHTQFERIQAELEEVARYDTDTDPATGEPKPVPVYALSGTRAQAAIEQQQDIQRRLRLLVTEQGYGIEAQKRLDQALYESAQARAALQEQLEDAAEAKRRAAHNERERRINERAELLGRMQRNSV